MMNLSIKEDLSNNTGILVYFGNHKMPYGLIYDEPITEDMLDMICDKIKEKMREVLKK